MKMGGFQRKPRFRIYVDELAGVLYLPLNPESAYMVRNEFYARGIISDTFLNRKYYVYVKRVG